VFLTPVALARLGFAILARSLAGARLTFARVADDIFSLRIKIRSVFLFVLIVLVVVIIIIGVDRDTVVFIVG
jgi:hypothetical protein